MRAEPKARAVPRGCPRKELAGNNWATTKLRSMALYYFDVDDNGNIFADDQGIECADFNQVKQEAIRTLVDDQGQPP
ncbi:hypothetical protein MesoLj131a_56690 [Mesorhizobium sp. 131-2-1]|nr:hypothetical protein MesoLj131a_56690 [Mesorhizobium sp. 131-2-1]